MSRKGTTGESRVWFVTTIADPATPTDDEINAGVDLTPFLTRDGFNAPQTVAQIDASDASTRRNKNIPGNIEAGLVTLTCYRDSVAADDDAWTALAPDTAGYIVERPFGGSAAAAAAAQKVNVFTGTVATRSPQQWGDEARKFVVEFSSTALNEDVAVTS